MNTELIIIIIMCVGVILLIGYKYMNKNTSSETSDFENEKKELKYFGGDYCQFSNSTSNAYKVIKDFEEEYSDRVNVNYYWVGLDDEVMKELNVEYVPYLLNSDNKQIEIGLPEGTDASKLSEEELKELLLRTIYNKL
jgi:hypothetical protein